MQTIKQLPSNILIFLIRTSKRHKKKLITLAIIAILIFLAKKKLTISHIIYVVKKIIDICSYLPLPQPLTYRQTDIYSHTQLQPLNQIIKLMKVEQISNKIKNKVEGGWNQLKHAVISGVVMSLSVYNIKSFYEVVRLKYRADFKLLNSQVYFNQFIDRLNNKFQQSLELSYQLTRDTLYQEINKLQIRQVLNIEQIQQNLTNLVGKMFKKKYDYDSEYHGNVIKYQKITPKVHMLFQTPYLPIPQSNKCKELVKGVFGGFINLLKLPLKIFQLVPNPCYSISSQRFNFIKMKYILPIKKVTIIRNNAERMNEVEILCKLVLKQIQEITQTLNFSTLVYQYAQLNLKIFINRMKIYMQKNKKLELKVADLLPILYKIIKQEIFTDKAKKQQFYEVQILKILRITQSQNSQNHPPDYIQLKNSILQEIHNYKQFNYLQKQFQQKYFHERSKIAFSPVSLKKNKVEGEQMQQMLSMLQNNQNG